MKNINLIIEDSTDLPIEYIEKSGIKVVNLNVTFGTDNFVDIDKNYFYKRMNESSELPKTSAPTPEAYIKLFDKDRDNLVLSMSGKLSGSYSSANLAKEIYNADNKNTNIEVFDTLNGCIGSGLMAYFVDKMILSGNTLQQIKEKLIELRDRVLQIGVLETLDNAIKGGRVSKTKAFVANVLNLKPIVEILDGEVKVTDKARGIKNGIKKIAETLVKNIEESSYKYTVLGISHANNIELAEYLKEILSTKINIEEILVTEMDALMATHAGEGAVLVAAL